MYTVPFPPKKQAKLPISRAAAAAHFWTIERRYMGKSVSQLQETFLCPKWGSFLPSSLSLSLPCILHPLFLKKSIALRVSPFHILALTQHTQTHISLLQQALVPNSSMAYTWYKQGIQGREPAANWGCCCCCWHGFQKEKRREEWNENVSGWVGGVNAYSSLRLCEKRGKRRESHRVSTSVRTVLAGAHT